MHKLFADPVHGFIKVQNGLVLDILQTPEVQRLRRIRQMGTAYLVFPSGEHSRFGHALGAMALMQDALSVLREKGVEITEQEWEGALLAALLHDIGHGPFSHTLENVFFQNPDFRHEQMSYALMEDLNRRFEGRLDCCLRIFEGSYDKPFLNQLVSGQLDIDRLDYLRRDAHFSGVVEGIVGVERIIKTLNVHEGQLVVEAKGGYAVENYLLSRRQMYGQVYLHKTVYAADFMLESIFKRRRFLQQPSPQESEALRYFLDDKPKLATLETRKAFLQLDDTDILQALKAWQFHEDGVLRFLSERFLQRQFFKTYLFHEMPDVVKMESLEAEVLQQLQKVGLENTIHLPYFIGTKEMNIKGYQPDTPILLLFKNGEVREISQISNANIIRALTLSEKRIALIRFSN